MAVAVFASDGRLYTQRHGGDFLLEPQEGEVEFCGAGEHCFGHAGQLLGRGRRGRDQPLAVAGEADFDALADRLAARELLIVELAGDGGRRDGAGDHVGEDVVVGQHGAGADEEAGAGGDTVDLDTADGGFDPALAGAEEGGVEVAVVFLDQAFEGRGGGGRTDCGEVQAGGIGLEIRIARVVAGGGQQQLEGPAFAVGPVDQLEDLVVEVGVLDQLLKALVELG